jgi:hypothetical protein
VSANIDSEDFDGPLTAAGASAMGDMLSNNTESPEGATVVVRLVFVFVTGKVKTPAEAIRNQGYRKNT